MTLSLHAAIKCRSRYELLFFAHEKGLGHMFQKKFSCSPILFFRVTTSQKWFLAITPVWTAIESENFIDFVQRAATAIV